VTSVGAAAVDRVGGVSAGSCVLIVGDDPAPRLALSSLLAPLGYRIVEARSGLDARECVSRQEFAVVLLDIRTSAADGFDTATFIRSRGASRLTPIIFLTSLERPEREMTMGYAMGAVDFVVAPFLPATLQGKVSLFADLSAKTQALVEHARRLRLAAAGAAEAMELHVEMLERMEELGRAKSDFVSKISHELRSPLTSVIGYIEILADGGPGEPNAEQRRMLTIIERNSRRLLALIEDLLTMSRVEAGTFQLEIGPVDLGEIVSGVVEATAPAVAKDLTVDLGRDLALTGDREQLERALLNLVSNAVKFTPASGRIEIRGRTDGDEIALAVRDTGSGIPAGEQGHLFARFFRATRSKEQEIPGTGLGLYIVKQIVDLHGGTIAVDSTRAGSTFTLRLPVAGPPADPLALVRHL